MKFGNVFPKAFGVLVELRTNNASERSGILPMYVFLVRSQMVASGELFTTFFAFVWMLVVALSFSFS